MKVSKGTQTFYNYKKLADLSEKTFGRTDEYKFQDERLNEEFFGGLAKPNATNIILLFGSTGVGKSLLSLNVVASAIREKKKFALILLEDDPEEALVRLRRIIPEKEIYAAPQIVLGSTDIKEYFTEDEALRMFDDFYKNQGVDIIILDHIQFMFEASESQRHNENEYIRQRRFIQRINHLVKAYKKTIVLISHTRKGDVAEGGLDAATGSNSIPQVATKAISIYRKGEQLYLKQEKSRYTKNNFDPIPIHFGLSDDPNDKDLRLFHQNSTTVGMKSKEEEDVV